MTELWFRNPKKYISVIKEVTTQYRLLWEQAFLIRNNIDPYQLQALHFGFAADWQYIVVDSWGKFAKHYDNRKRVKGVFPVWDAELDDPSLLVEYLENPLILEDSIPSQEPRVFITGFNLTRRRSEIFQVANLAEKYPEVKIHLYNSYSYSGVFGMGFNSGDLNPHDLSSTGSIVLPSGRVCFSNVKKSFDEFRVWIESLGFNPDELVGSTNERLRYNIVSAIWASKYFTELPNFKGKIKYVPIDDAIGIEVLKRNVPHSRIKKSIQEGDRKACDFCSLWAGCKYYREGSVCTVPGSEFKKIAEQFKTRSSERIADGIAGLVAVNLDRISTAHEAEKETEGVINPELSKLIDQTIKNGLALATLYRAKEEGEKANGKVIINITGGGAGKVETLSAPPSVAKELAARAVSELEASGIQREGITEDHINEWMAKNIIEGEIETNE